jgi:hypothetical protein
MFHDIGMCISPDQTGNRAPGMFHGMVTICFTICFTICLTICNLKCGKFLNPPSVKTHFSFQFSVGLAQLVSFVRSFERRGDPEGGDHRLFLCLCGEILPEKELETGPIHQP